MPLIDKYWIPHGMKDWSVALFPQTNPLTADCTQNIIVQTTIYWDRVEDLQSTLAAPETNKTRADTRNFTNVQPETWVSKIGATRNL